MRFLWALFLALSALCAQAGECTPWPQWQGFLDHFVSPDGRVVDPSTPRKHTTSEGQSYALFFALVANDPTDFSRILAWTEKNLAGGDLSAKLPAWQWGKKDDGSLGVVDENSAADSDLWIAYDLVEAGARWHNEKYTALGAALAARILKEESEDLPGLGRTLLPGAQSFRIAPGVWKLNPSYVPLQLVRRMAYLYPEWRALVPTSVDLVVRASPAGFAPDWVLYKADSGFQPDSDSFGSWNAIRVYLWAGMLSDEDPVRELYLDTFSPMAKYVAQKGLPPLDAGSRDGSTKEDGPAGFSAALLPFLAASKLEAAVKTQSARVTDEKLFSRADNYYAQALALFGTGWIENRFRFSFDGKLETTCG